MYITLAKGQASLQNNTHQGTADVRRLGCVAPEAQKRGVWSLGFCWGALGFCGV